MTLLSEKNQLRLMRARTRARHIVRASASRLCLTAAKLFGKSGGDADGPYAMVTAPVRPRLPHKSGSVAVDPYEY